MGEEKVKEHRYCTGDSKSTKEFIETLHKLARENPELICL